MKRTPDYQLEPNDTLLEPGIHTIHLSASTYRTNNGLAVIAAIDGEEYATITVNLPDALFAGMPGYAYIDTNHCPWAEKFLKKNKIAKPVKSDFGPVMAQSGYCSYPLYKFNMKLFQ